MAGSNANAKAAIRDNRPLYLLAYVFTIISGIVLYLTLAKTDARLRKHSIQAIILGVIMLILDGIFFLMPIIGEVLAILVWLYGIYIGFEAFNGTDVRIPWITDMVESGSQKQG